MKTQFIPLNGYYPLTYLPSIYNTKPVTFNPEYIKNLISLRITDYFSPSQFAQNPLFAKIDTFHQNIGILQTALKSLEKILTLTDALKQINNPSEEIINEFQKQINDIINDCKFNGLNIFQQKININGKKIDLNIPVFKPETQTIEQYSKLISKKYDSLFKTLKHLSFTLPFETSFNPSQLYYTAFTSQTFNYTLITPQALELLLL